MFSFAISSKTTPTKNGHITAKAPAKGLESVRKAIVPYRECACGFQMFFIETWEQ